MKKRRLSTQEYFLLGLVVFGILLVILRWPYIHAQILEGLQALGWTK